MALRSSELESFTRFTRQLRWIIVVVVIAFAVPLFIYARYLDRRLDAFESSLRYRPPAAEEMEGEVGHVAELEHRYLTVHPVLGQVVHVPAYSHVYHGDGDPYLLTITLSVRNTSATDSILVTSVRYFDTKGKEVRSYLEKPLRLAALAATEFLIERGNSAGGSGASFLVKWVSEVPVTAPSIEAIMIDTKGQQGISFARRGSVLSEIVVEPGSRPETGAAESQETPDEPR